MAGPEQRIAATDWRTGGVGAGWFAAIMSAMTMDEVAAAVRPEAAALAWCWAKRHRLGSASSARPP